MNTVSRWSSRADDISDIDAWLRSDQYGLSDFRGFRLRVGTVGDPARGSDSHPNAQACALGAPGFDAAENQALRRLPHGPPSPGVIRATAKNRFGTQLHRTVITIEAAPAPAAPPDLIYFLSVITALTSRSRAGSPPAPTPARPDALGLCDRATAV